MPDPFLNQTLENVQAGQAPLAPGQAIIGGRFVLQRQLGQGGMGQVWLARDTTLDEPRALKFVLPMLLSDANARKRLRNEARLGTHLAHPRIVRVFDFAEETGGSPLAAIVMEFVEGRTLNELLAEQELGFFEPKQIESWINDVIEGLRYAHEEKQRYHLDLKPANIIIEATSGRAKLLDFGISRSAKDTITRLTGQSSSGTLPYMSPQQLDGEPPCAADDVYGLGATIYELLTGTPPFFRGKLDDQIRSKDPGSMMERRRQNVKEGLNAQMGEVIDSRIEHWSNQSLNKAADSRKLMPLYSVTTATKRTDLEIPKNDQENQLLSVAFCDPFLHLEIPKNDQENQREAETDGIDVFLNNDRSPIITAFLLILVFSIIMYFTFVIFHNSMFQSY